ncbi:MAG: hypothetical protein SOZ07_07885 [Prevotella sp.]|nr:hypothetical protein [Prevotella sp.]MDD7272747.1 hypothetical protein [Prevotellaceae bacterium]MDY3936551.1 hypothetical protein [Prevotella sp.]MDY4218307.1 hypothetical protein [Prevotella sp.]
MSNKRDLKRTIHCICGDLFAETIAVSLYNNEVNPENVEALLTSIVRLNSNYINRISHVQPGMKPRLYFQELKNSFSKEANEIVDQICNLG